MTDFHMHAVGICRHCGHSDTHSVDLTEGAAVESIQRIVAEARERNDLPADTRMQEISAGIFRLQWGDHDLIFTTMRCEEPFEDCVAGFADYMMRKIAARKVMELMNKLAGGEAAEPGDNKSRIDDVANRLLSQLPNDFLNGLNN